MLYERKIFNLIYHDSDLNDIFFLFQNPSELSSESDKDESRVPGSEEEMS